jgi:hypothetical protein
MHRGGLLVFAFEDLLHLIILFFSGTSSLQKDPTLLLVRGGVSCFIKELYYKDEDLANSQQQPTTSQMSFLLPEVIPIWPTDREEALAWLREGRDPFEPIREYTEFQVLHVTAFHEAAKRKDLELLLHMVAEPGTAWTKRFLFCRNMEVAVPAKGLARISSLDLSDLSDVGCGGRYYFAHEGNSMEGLEVLMMYGYKLSNYDKDSIFFDGLRMADDDPTYILKMVKFCLATTSSSLVTGESSSEFGKKNHLETMLEMAAFETRFSPSVERYFVELARVLLKAGANPNPHGSCPPLFGAISKGPKEMVKLLIDYGADVSAVAPPRHDWLLDNADDVEAVSRHDWLTKATVSVALVAERYGMLELILDRPATPVVVNAREYIHQLRLEITMPLRIAISEIVVVAFMRATGQTPPLGIISSSILSFCNFIDYD